MPKKVVVKSSDPSVATGGRSAYGDGDVGHVWVRLWGVGTTNITVEYSVRGAMLAIYQFFGVEREVPAIYNGLLDPKVGFKVLETIFH